MQLLGSNVYPYVSFNSTAHVKDDDLVFYDIVLNCDVPIGKGIKILSEYDMSCLMQSEEGTITV